MMLVVVLALLLPFAPAVTNAQEVDQWLISYCDTTGGEFWAFAGGCGMKYPAFEPTDAPDVQQIDAATPEKFQPLLGKWKYDMPRYVTVFEIKEIVNGAVSDINYTFEGRLVPGIAATVSDENGALVVKIVTLQGEIKLQHADTFGGMLWGTYTRGGKRPVDMKFYRDK